MTATCYVEAHLLNTRFMVGIGNSNKGFIHCSLGALTLEKVPLYDPNHMNGIKALFDSP